MRSNSPKQEHRARMQGRRHLGAELNDECLKLEIFHSLKEAQVIIEAWRDHYNPASQHPSVYAIEGQRVS